MSARLVPLSLSATSAPVIAIQRPVILIGRHPECDIRIDSPKVSRRHCCLALAYDRVMIRDLGSRNGLRVNGRVVEETALRPGDEIAIGHILYRLEDVAPPPPPPSAPAKASLRPPLDDFDELVPLDD
jgi:pSer/pThr/pTyr-binding forkhead associated (FHA) protein